MTKIKSVDEVIPDESNYGGQEVRDILTQDRQAFEEAIVEALEGMKNRRYYEDITHGDEELKIIQARSMEIGHNRCLDQAIALVRSIYQDNK